MSELKRPDIEALEKRIGRLCAAPGLFAYVRSLEARLAQPLPEDVAKLVVQLRDADYAHRPHEVAAANALEAQARRIAELERRIQEIRGACIQANKFAQPLQVFIDISNEALERRK